jgi:photosystem II stability/assembly factor-like uncharacterized protein
VKRLLPFVVPVLGIILCLSGYANAGWERLGSPCNCNVSINALIFVGSDMYAGADYPNGALVSHDSGMNWESLGLTGYKVSAIAASGPNLLAGLDYSEGIYLSTDGGTSWTRPLANVTIYSFLVAGSTVLAGADSGRIYRSTDNGLNWTEGNIGAICLVRTFAILGTSIFAGTDYQWPITPAGIGVCRSTDDGVTWAPTANSGLWCREEWGLCVVGNNLLAAACNGILTSTNGGASWTETSNDRLQGGGFKCGFAAGGGKVFATTCGSGRIPMSADNGLNWTNVNRRELNIDHGVLAMVVNGDYLYVASELDDRSIWRCPLSELYICGDANGDAVTDISDVVSLIAYVFSGGAAPEPWVLGDANCDGSLDISDAVYLIQWIFAGGPSPCETCQ